MTDKILTHDPNFVTEKAVYFYTPRFYVFDNFSAFAVEIWNKKFMTSEHAYQWKKFSDDSPAVAEKIFLATSANAAKKISEAHKEDFDSSWHDIKVGVMEEVLRAKLEQHQKVKDLLLETGRKDIIENSPIDYYWGIGADGSGENQLGKLWMKLRSELQSHER